LAVFDDIGLDFENVPDGVASQSELLRSFDDTDDGELEREVEQGPDLLSNRSVVAVREIIKIKSPDEDLVVMASA